MSRAVTLKSDTDYEASFPIGWLRQQSADWGDGPLRLEDESTSEKGRQRIPHIGVEKSILEVLEVAGNADLEAAAALTKALGGKGPEALALRMDPLYRCKGKKDHPAEEQQSRSSSPDDILACSWGWGRI